MHPVADSSNLIYWSEHSMCARKRVSFCILGALLWVAIWLSFVLASVGHGHWLYIVQIRRFLSNMIQSRNICFLCSLLEVSVRGISMPSGWCIGALDKSICYRACFWATPLRTLFVWVGMPLLLFWYNLETRCWELTLPSLWLLWPVRVPMAEPLADCFWTGGM